MVIRFQGVKFLNSNQKGNIGESKALAYLLYKDYEVFLPFGTASKCDMIAVKGPNCFKVSVKSTAAKDSRKGSWIVRLRQKRGNKDYYFDPLDSDILLVYIIPEDTIVEFKSIDIKSKTAISIKEATLR